MARSWRQNRQPRRPSPAPNSSAWHSRPQRPRTSLPVPQYPGTLLASDYGGTQSTHQASLFSAEDEATRYSGRPSDDASLAPPILFDGVHGVTFDEDFLLETQILTHGGEPSAGQGAHVANVEPLSLSSIGGAFSGSSHLDVTTQSDDGHPLPLVVPGPSGGEDLGLQLDLPAQPNPSEHFDLLEQPGPWEQHDLSEHFVHSQWRNMSNNEHVFAQDESPWNSQHQSTHLLHPNYIPETYSGWAGTPTASISSFQTGPSSQGSQGEGSQQPIGCDSCGKEFRSFKALQRHRSKAAVHQNEEDGVFVCKCGSVTNRKDNFKSRHFENCTKPHLPSDVFTCICGYKDASVSSMNQHFGSCPSQNKRGRPPRPAPSPQSYLSYS